jgi:hypothetical protein
MRIARKLVLLALAATAAMAMYAAPANAVDPIEVVNEKLTTGNMHCSNLAVGHATGGCLVHAEGTITMQVFIFVWVNERRCDLELIMRIGEDGEVGIDDMVFATAVESGSEECLNNPPIDECDLPWEGHGEEQAAHNIHAVKAVCIDPAEGDICGSTMEYDIIENEAAESYSVAFVNANIGAFCRINGTLTLESTNTDYARIHVNHL